MNLGWPWNLIVLLLALGVVFYFWMRVLGRLFNDAMEDTTTFKAGVDVLLMLVVGIGVPVGLWLIVAGV